MTDAAPLAVVVPIGTALLLLILSPLKGRRHADVISVIGALATVALCGTLVARSPTDPIVHWMGGWAPRSHHAIGIDLYVDRMSAGVALLAATLTLGAFVVAWRYFDDTIGTRFHALTLLFLAGMIGFAFSGDVFNLFVMFELMGAAAYGLTAYKSEEAGALQGSFNFAVSNSIGAFMMLLGVGLLYAHGGTLNLVELGTALASPARPPGVVVVACVLVMTGLLVKSASVPFHLWLADAHAVAPTPVCLLLSGVMVELGLYGVARVYWTVFSEAIDPSNLRPVLVAAGIVTAVVGAAMSTVQQHLKRLLAFSTISHAGIVLVGIGLLESRALAGSALYTVGHGFVKGALFACVAILIHRYGAMDTSRLFGRARRLRTALVVWFVAGVALAGLPPFATYLGKGMIDEALVKHHLGWVAAVLTVASAATGAAVLAAGGRVFFGWGTKVGDASASSSGEEEQPDVETHESGTPVSMKVGVIALLALGLAAGVAPGMARLVDEAAAHVQHPTTARRAVLGLPEPDRAVIEKTAKPTASAVAVGIATSVGAIAGAALLLRHRRSIALHWLRRLHTGHPGDVTAWLTVGFAAFGAALAIFVRSGPP